MATYAELYGLRNDSALRNKIAVAVVVKAQSLIDKASPTTGEIAWADAALKDPNGKATDILNYVLAANKALNASQIQGASDSSIQTNVDASVDKLIAGGVV